MKTLRLLTIVALVILVYLCSCSTQTSTEEDLAAIAVTRDQLTTALIEDDVDGILSPLTDDHITMAPNEPALDDLATLRQWHERRIEEYTMDGSFSSLEVRVAGDWAFECWSFPYTLTPKTGGIPVQGKNKGIWIWKRQRDGTWKLARSIWNSDNPLPTVE
jgi:ketosteroid isomerase-like protein